MLRALAHPVRLGIIASSRNARETCACDFTDVFAVRQPTISQHLKVLQEAGLVQTRFWHRRKSLLPSSARYYAHIILLCTHCGPRHLASVIVAQRRVFARLPLASLLVLATFGDRVAGGVRR
jgi:DNA-binding transcriptional ArsR family regulator